jgi:hypothetical protein
VQAGGGRWAAPDVRYAAMNGGCGGGSQAYLWSAGTVCWVPGDMMIDWVCEHEREEVGW